MAEDKRPLSRIPMFELPTKFGNAIYESTYASDYQKKRSYERLDDLEGQHNDFFTNKEVSQSLQTFADYNKANTPSLYPDDTNKKLYKSYKYGLQQVHRSKKIPGVNYFRSQMDQNILDDARQILESRSQGEFNIFKKQDLPSFMKLDSHRHTNSERNVRYIRQYNGVLLPYVPAVPTLKKPLPPIRTDESYHEKEFPYNKPIEHYNRVTTSSQGLDRYLNNMQLLRNKQPSAKSTD